MLRKIALMFATISLLVGCGHISGGVAPSNIPLAPESYTEIGAVRGEDCVYYLLGLIPLAGGNETKDALKDALSQQPGTTALVNITADTYSQNFIIVSRMCTQVDGIAVRAK